MTRKTALKKAQGPKAERPAPVLAIEPRPDRSANPLVIEPTIHPGLRPLFDALVMVAVRSDHVADDYNKLLELKAWRGLPQPVEFLNPPWVDSIREWSECYQGWCGAIAKAKDAAKCPTVAAIMDAGEPRPGHRWTTQTIVDLDTLASTMHPVNLGGCDGVGFVRCGLPPLPADLAARKTAVHRRIIELRSVPELATVAVEPLAERDGDSAPATKLPTLEPWAMEAWRAQQAGMKQKKIASTLAEKYKDPSITQPRVSEQIQRAKKHVEASGLGVISARVLPQVGSRAPARTFNPALADMGERTDGSARYLRDRARQQAEDAGASDDER